MCSTPTPFTERDVPDLSGYVAIVTGGISGIGYETTKQLALHNARVYIASRSRERVDQAIRKMQDETGRPLDLRFLQLDLNDLSSVATVADSFSTMGAQTRLVAEQRRCDERADELYAGRIRNAVAGQLSGPSSSMDRVRVINITSDLAINIGPKTMNFEDVNMASTKGPLAALQRYAHSKQGSIRHAKELNDRYANKGVTAYSVHPGIVPSNLQSHDPGFVGIMMRIGMKFRSTTPLESCHNSLFCATTTAAALDGKGKYFTPVGKINPKADYLLDDWEGNARLWQGVKTLCSGCSRGWRHRWLCAM